MGTHHLLALFACLAACGGHASAPPTNTPSNRAVADETFMSKLDLSRPATWNFDLKMHMTYEGMGHKDVVNGGGDVVLETAPDTSTLLVTADLKVTTSAGKSDTVTLSRTPFDPSTPATSEQRAALQVFYPQVSRPLHPGESDAVPFSMPMKINGEDEPITTTRTIKFVGWEDRRGRRCARLDHDLTAASKEQFGMKMTIAAGGTTCIDPVDGMVVTSELETTIDAQLAPGKTMRTAGTISIQRR